MSRSAFGRADRLIQKKRKDAYEETAKLPEGTVCPDCGAVVTGGSWSWDIPGSRGRRTLCPACRRIQERLPAGQVQLSGTFLDGHRREILNLIRNLEDQEKRAHPLERIMTIYENRRRLEVITTGIHLARLIGESVSRSYKGDLDFQYGEGEKTIRVQWTRDA